MTLFSEYNPLFARFGLRASGMADKLKTSSFFMHNYTAQQWSAMHLRDAQIHVYRM